MQTRTPLEVERCSPILPAHHSVYQGKATYCTEDKLETMQMCGALFEKCIHGQLEKTKHGMPPPSNIYSQLLCSPESGICVVVVDGGTAATHSHTLHSCRIPSKYAFLSFSKLQHEG